MDEKRGGGGDVLFKRARHPLSLPRERSARTPAYFLVCPHSRTPGIASDSRPKSPPAPAARAHASVAAAIAAAVADRF